MRNSSQHRLETRVCPGCNKKHTYPARQTYHSAACMTAAKNRAEAKRAGTVTSELGGRIKLAIARMKSKASVRSISEHLDVAERTIIREIDTLRSAGHSIELLESGSVASEGTVRVGAGKPLVVHTMTDYKDGFHKFGTCGDNHLGSKHERLDVLEAIYDVYSDEGITQVFNTGTWIEGEAGKMNFADIKVFGMDDQIDYWIEHFPKRDGITTYFVAGDDHEGWYQKRERVEIGRYAMLRAQAAGRDDLVYLGYMEADVLLKAKHGSRTMKVVHPGGGSAYALSYSMQKWVEALQGGEKPAIVLAGHYHKFDHNYYREVHVVQTGCTVDQSCFMRKMKLQAHVGGCIVRLNQADDGRITRFQVEWMPFYDIGYYVGAAKRERNFTAPGAGRKVVLA